MTHIHADGSEEQGPRPEADIALIIEENRIAAQINLRTNTERRLNGPRSSENRRSIVSSFERNWLLSECG